MLFGAIIENSSVGCFGGVCGIGVSVALGGVWHWGGGGVALGGWGCGIGGWVVV